MTLDIFIVSFPEYTFELFVGKNRQMVSIIPMDQGTSELCSAFSTDDGINVFTIADVVYDKYIILHNRNTNDEGTLQTVELYGRVFLWQHLGVGKEGNEGTLDTNWSL
jgi:hypothetical protein